MSESLVGGGVARSAGVGFQGSQLDVRLNSKGFGTPVEIMISAKY